MASHYPSAIKVVHVQETTVPTAEVKVNVKAEQAKAQAKAIGKNILKGGCQTAVVSGKVSKTVWNGTFGIAKGLLTVVQKTPNVVVGGICAIGKAVSDEYGKA